MIKEEREFRSFSVASALVAFVAIGVLGYFAGTLQLHRDFVGGLKGVFSEQHSLDTSSLQETYRALRDNFDGEVDQRLIIEGANKGMVEALGDNYTAFLSSSEAEEFNKSLSGDVGSGVGIEVGLRGDQPTVVRVLRDNPAEKAGVRAGDVILAVNDDSTIGATVSATVEKIRGDEGTTVKLTLARDGAKQEVSVTRARINNPSVYSSLVDGVGVMTITRFDNDTGSLARQAARDFKSKNVKGVVVDLRGNGGGYVNAAKAVASIWLDNKVVVVEKSGERVVDEIRSDKGQPILDGIRTVVLVNQSSASASEIVAGALRDHKVATIIGETTFGKGSVQRLLNLSEGAMLKVTTARWYTPSGLTISEKGIQPDKKVDITAEDINANRDPQLDAAIGSARP